MFFKPGFFEAALGVNLTTMLVMTTIIINVRQILPTTSYIKMFDIWLIKIVIIESQKSQICPFYRLKYET